MAHQAAWQWMTFAATRLERKSVMNHLRRSLGLLAGGAFALLALIASAPAALATRVPPGPAGTTGVTPVPAPTVHVITTGGMAGWQITLIALASALLAAAAAVLLDRAWATHHAAPRTTA
jgi:hypothetical protein